MRIGIIGTGRIARRFVPEALCVDNVQITAIYNPHPGSAERFVREHCLHDEAVKAYEAIKAADIPEEFWNHIDAAYIASPHETHAGYIKESLAHEKHVLCEKPMVLRKAEAEECFRIAEQKGLILMEGIKTAYCPGYQRLMELAKSGIIGEIRYIDSCFTKLEAANSRELNDTKYGGSFTELGSYVMLPLFDLLESTGEPSFTSVCDNRGIDLFTKLEVKNDGSIGTAECGLGVKAEGRLLIGGTKGFIRTDAPWWKTKHIEIHFEDESKTIIYDQPFEGDGLWYEIAEFIRQVKDSNENRAESAARNTDRNEPDPQGEEKNSSEKNNIDSGRNTGRESNIDHVKKADKVSHINKETGGKIKEITRARSISMAAMMETFLLRRASAGSGRDSK